MGVEKEYLPVPFHNFSHALDCVHTVGRILTIASTSSFLTELERASLLIAALAHDMGHPGLNNGFLSETGHELALRYNDLSPLENMHCAKLYGITTNPLTDIFQNLSREQYREVRGWCIETILHTDMMLHNAIVKELQMLYQMNTEALNERGEAVPEAPLRLAEIEVFSHPETKRLAKNSILHCADVSNPCKSWTVTTAWAECCLEEFFAQGDREKELGIPVQFLNDREKLNRPNSQIGFIEFMIAPLYTATLRVFPNLKELGEHLSENLASWADVWAKETSPSEEELQKVAARVDKVRSGLLVATKRVL